MDEQQFRTISESALAGLEDDLQRAADRYGFEVDRNQGALTIEFESPRTKFVVSPNFPVRQLWISARVKSFKLDWNSAARAFVFQDGRNLHTLVGDLISEQLNTQVTL